MYMYIYMYIYVYIYVYICIYIYVYICLGEFKHLLKNDTSPPLPSIGQIKATLN